MWLVTSISLMIGLCLVISLMDNPSVDAGQPASRAAVKQDKPGASSGSSQKS